jgi:hypothetical protein
MQLQLQQAIEVGLECRQSKSRSPDDGTFEQKKISSSTQKQQRHERKQQAHQHKRQESQTKDNQQTHPVRTSKPKEIRDHYRRTDWSVGN